MTKWLSHISRGNIKTFLTYHLLIALLGMGTAFANPVLNNIAAGDVNVQQTSTTTTVNQNSQQAILNWDSFNIGAAEKTQFVQPNASATALNRIDPNQGVSQIFGQLSANGRIILINQAGIYFGPTARVDVGGIIASTSNMTDQNFLAGQYIFDQPSPYAASIVNEGNISAADYGLVVLAGSSVTNAGTIQARMGNVVLASGNKFTVDLYGDQLVNFVVDEAADQAKVRNSGSIIADGGMVMMSAKAAQGVVDHVINMDGVIQANSVAQKNGEVILLGGNEGEVHVSGKISASGKLAGQTGGKVKVTGKHVYIASGAEIDASGDVGGGEILIGGDAHGQGALANAKKSYVATGAIVNADAITYGNGGKIVIWSDEATYVYGSLTAKGGLLSGDGGFVETSGHYLDINGVNISTFAANGKSGILLLDPDDMYIADYPVTSPFNSVLCTGAGPFACSPLTTPSSYLQALFLGQLLNLNNVDVTATGSIILGDVANGFPTVEGLTNGVYWGNASTTNLVLTASQNIVVDAPLNFQGATQPKNLYFRAGGAVYIWYPITSAVNLTIDGSGSAVNFNGAIVGSLSNPLRSIYVSSNYTSNFNGGTNFYTIGSIGFNGPVQVASTVSMNSNDNNNNGTITLGAISGTSTLTLNTLRSVTLNGSVSGISSLDITGSTNINTSSINVGTQYYRSPTTLGASTTLTAGTIVHFLNTLTGNSNSLTLSGSGSKEFNAAVSGINQLDVTGPAFINIASPSTLSTTGSQTYNNGINAGANIELISSGSYINILGGISGSSFGVVLRAPSSQVIFTSGDVTASSLDVVGQAIFSGNQTVATTVHQAYHNLVNLSNTTLNNTGGLANIIRFYNGVNVGTNVNINANGNGVQFDNSIGGGGQLTSLTITGLTRLNGGLVLSSSQVFNSLVTLGSDSTFTTNNGSGPISILGGMVGSGFSATFNNYSTPLTLSGSITGLSSLGTAGGGAINLNSSISTSGIQQYAGPVSLSGASDVALTSIGGTISFGSTLNGPRGIALSSASGVTFGGNVGNTSALGVLSVSGGSLTVSGATVINTVDNMVFSSPVNLNISSTFTSSTNSVAFDSSATVNGNFALTLNAPTVSSNPSCCGIVTINSVFGGSTPLQSLNVTTGNTAKGFLLGNNISTNGTQTYTGQITLTASPTLTGGVNLVGALTGGGNSLTLAGGGNKTLGNTISGVAAFSVSGPTAINTSSISTTGAQTYNGAVTLGTNPNLSSSSTINLANTVSGVNTFGLGLSGTTITLGGAITAVTTFDVTGPTNLNASVSSSSTQNYNSAITLGSASTLSSSGAINLISTVNGGFGLSLSSVQVSLYGVIGGGTPLASFSTSGGVTNFYAGATAVTTSGSQTYNSTIELVPTLTTLTAGSGVSFSGNVSGNSHNLTLNATSAVDFTLANSFTNVNNLSINGSGGTDTLRVTGGDNKNWNLTSNNTGNITGISGVSTANFSSFENIQGGSGNDSFNFSSGISISGTLNGGVGGVNNLNYNSYGSAISVNLQTGVATGIGGSFSNINQVVGDASNLGAVTGANATNTWNVTALNTGNVGVLTTGFSNIYNWVGGTGSDTLNFGGLGSVLNIVLSGLGASDGFAGTSNIGIGGSFNNMNALTGTTSGANSLTGPALTNNWSITGSNAGSITSPNSLTFSAFQSLVGGSSADNFTLTTGSLTGSINGGAGSNTLTGGSIGINTWGISGANSGSLTNTGGFSNISALIGGSTADNFVFSGGSVSTVNGAGGSDTLDFSGVASALNISLTGVGSSDGFAGTSNIGITSSFDNINVLTGRTSQANSLTGPNLASNWSITGANSGSITSANSLTFSAFQSLIGGINADSFALSGGTLSGSIAGGSGSDSLTADNLTNSWTIDGSNAGSVASVNGTVNFSSIENVAGGNTNDTFNMQSAGSLTSLNGGVGGINSLDYSAYGSAISVNLQTLVATGIGSFSNINKVVGDATNLGTVTGANSANTWTVASGLNAGSVGVLTNGFTNINNWVGGTNTDTLNFGGLGNVLNIALSGLGSSDGFAGTSNIGIGGSFSNMNILTGTTSGTNSLTGPDLASSWSVTGANSGSITSANTLAFSAFQSLIGGTDADSFALNGGTLSGSIAGGSGTDTLTDNGIAGNAWVVTGLNTGSVTGVASGFTQVENIVGGSGADSFTLSGGTLTGTINGGAGSNTLTADNVVNSWSITGGNSGAVTGTGGFSNIGNIVGGTTTDNFVFNGGSVATVDGGTGTGADTLDFGNLASVLNIALTGLGGSDGFAGTSNTGITGTFANIDAVVGTTSGNNTLTGTNATTGWDISGTNSGTVNTAPNDMTFSNFQNLTSGSGTNVFSFNGGSVTSINGANGTVTIDFSSGSTPLDIVLTALGSTNGFKGTSNVGLNTFDNIDLITGSSGVDTLTGANLPTVWTVTAANGGTITGTSTLNFTGFESLVGGSNADSFVLSGGTVANLINGGLGSNTLTGDNVANTWAITSNNAGSLTGITNGFTNIGSLVGGSSSDDFTFSPSTSITGSINAMGGTNTFAGLVTAASLTANAGSTTILVGNVTTTGNQAYNGIVTISTADKTLISSAGSISFATTVDGGFALSLNGNTGITIGGVIGGITPITNFDVTGATTLGSTVNSTGSQTYNNTVTLAADSSLVGGAISLGSIIGSTFNLSVDTSSPSSVINGVFAGSGGLTKAGLGTLTLMAANTNTGLTTINDGTLKLGAAGVIADGSSVTFANVAGAVLDLNNFSETIANLSGGGALGGNITLGSGTLTVTQASNLTYAGSINGSGGLIKNGGSTLTLSGANGYTGTTLVNAGTLQLGASNVIADASALTLAGGIFDLNDFNDQVGTLSGSSNITLGSGVLTVTQGSNATYAGAITGTSGGFTKDGSAILTLTNTSNSYAGATTINAGTLQVGAASVIPDSSSVIFANVAGAVLDLNNLNETIANLSGGGALGGNVNLGSGTLTVTQGGNTAYLGVISGSGGLIKNGVGTLTLSGANGYTGTTLINVGTLQLGASNVIADGSALTLAGGTFDLNNFNDQVGTLSGTSNITLGGGVLTVTQGSAQTYSGVISGNSSSGFTKLGGSTLILDGVNTLSGTITINAGVLQLGLGTIDNSLVSLNNAVGVALNLNNAAKTIGGLSGGGSNGGNVTIGTAILTVNQNSNTTYAGSISGTTGGLTKLGTGTLTISGNNSYNGPTTINNGVLQLGSTTAMPSTSSITIGALGTLDMNGFASAINSFSGQGVINLNNDVLISGINNDSFAFSGVIQGVGDILKSGTGTLTLSGANTYTGISSVANGIVVITGAGQLGSSTSETIVSAGATLQFLNAAIGNEPVTLNGTGFGGIGALMVQGTSSFSGPITLASNSLIAATGAADVLTLTGTMNGQFALTVNGAGTVNLGTLGNTTALTTLTANVANVGLHGNISTSGNQIYNGVMTLASGSSTLSSSAGTISFGNTINGAGDLTLNSNGVLTLSSAVGGITPLASLTTNVGGGLTFNGGSITTTGSQFYNNVMTFGSNTTLSTTTNGYIGINNNLDVGAHDLTFIGGAGDNKFTLGNAGGSVITAGNITVTGAGGNNTLVVNSSMPATWLVDANDQGSINNITTITGNFNFTGIGNLTGGPANDSFLINAPLSGAIQGGGGVNSLAINTSINIWQINGAGSGSVAGIDGGFSGIQTIANNSAVVANTYVFNDGGVIDYIDGGANSIVNNILDYSSYTSPVYVTLTADHEGLTKSGGQAITGSFINIGTVVGSGGGSSITMPNKTNTVLVNGFAKGSINDPVVFSNFNTIFGKGNTTINFLTFATVFKSLNYAQINGQTMYFYNVNYTGDYVQADGNSAAVSTAMTPYISIVPNTSSIPGMSPYLDQQLMNNLNDILQNQSTLDYQISWVKTNC